MRSLPSLRGAVVALLVLMFPAVLPGQQPGTFQGIVTDCENTPLRGVSISIVDVSSDKTLTVVTGDRGQYRAAGITPADYEIRAELSGFQARVVRSTFPAGAAVLDVDFRLCSSYVESVTVLGVAHDDVMQATDIRESSARDIGEALARLGGVTKIRKGGIANDVVLHGYRSKDLAILVDGQRIYGACPNYMDPAVFHADFAEVDHIDLGKGPFDVENHGAIGGVINIVTKQPANGFHAEANVSAGSFGYVNPTATASYGAQKFGVLAGFSQRASDAYADGSGNRFTDYANYRKPLADDRAFDARTGWMRMHAMPRAGNLFRLSYATQRASDVLYPYLQMDAIDDNADRYDAAYERSVPQGKVRTLAATLHYAAVDHSMDDALRVSAAGAPRTYSMMTDAASSVAAARLQLGFARTTAGIELTRRRWEAATVLKAAGYRPQYSIPDVATRSLGVFVNWTTRSAFDAQIDTGARVDWSQTDANESKANTNLYYAYHSTRSVSASDVMPSANVRVTRRFGDAWTVHAGVGHTERVPDPQERYFALSRMGTDWVGNPDLEPVRNTGLRADVSYQKGRFGASATLYHDWVSGLIALGPKNRINSVGGVMNAKAQTYENVNARMRGAEASITFALTNSLYASANAAYARGTKETSPADGITSPNVAEIPPLNGAMSLRYDRGRMFGEAELAMAARQENVDADLLEEPTPGYGVVNLRVGRQFDDVRVTLAVDNVFDRFYLDYTSYQRDPFRSTVRVPEPGRNVYVNVSYRY